MKGHEYVREAIRTYLETAVPARLAAHLAGNGLSSPNPAELTFLLEDTLQGVTSFPAVLVKSTAATLDKWVSTRTFWYSYDVEIIVACDHRVHGSFEAASVDRDRVLLAVRESLLGLVGLPDDIDIPARAMPEETGAAVETLAGVPLAAGTVRFTARVSETVADLDPPESIGASDLTVAAFDADDTLP